MLMMSQGVCGGAKNGIRAPRMYFRCFSDYETPEQGKIQPGVCSYALLVLVVLVLTM